MVLQAIGWILFGVGSALALVFGNLGVVTVRLPGLTFFLGLAFYASQLTLLHSLDSFHHLSALSYTLDDRVGVRGVLSQSILFNSHASHSNIGTSRITLRNSVSFCRPCRDSIRFTRLHVSCRDCNCVDRCRCIRTSLDINTVQIFEEI